MHCYWVHIIHSNGNHLILRNMQWIIRIRYRYNKFNFCSMNIKFTKFWVQRTFFFMPLDMATQKNLLCEMARRQILDGHKVFMCLTYSKQHCCNWRYALLCIVWSFANLLCIIISKQYVRLCLYVTSDNIGIILLLNYYLKLSWQGFVICFERNMRVKIKSSNEIQQYAPGISMNVNGAITDARYSSRKYLKCTLS